MLGDKELKKQFKEKCKNNPEKHYPVRFLKSRGFVRKTCSTCGTNYWTTQQDQTVCGDPNCSGGFRFIGNSPAKNKMDYIESWKAFAKTFEKLGYTEVKRYPVVARWNPTTDFTIASIAAFQPYIVTGEVDPPANPLVIPQFCLRFGDIDNVGITGAHYTGFIMMGQHAFVPPENYNTDLYLEHIHTWLSKGIGINDGEITFHEDAWAGGGNFGPSMEYFSRGLELGNQVYMQYEHTAQGNKELQIKVLDMGAGLERVPWFTQGTHNSYETTFPTVMKNLRERTGVPVDTKLMSKFLPHASFLNVDEVTSIEKAWQDIADKLDIDVKELKDHVLPLAALASIGDHTRSLLFAIADGGLPSNVGGMYNLRVILRRALNLIQQHGWHVSLGEVCQWHADYLKPLFPELKEQLNNVNIILEVEKKKHKATQAKSAQILQRLADKNITTETLIKLYDSNGIAPDLVKEEAEKHGKKVKIPDNFYAQVAEKHGKQVHDHSTDKEANIDFGEMPDTKALYYDDYTLSEFEGEVLAINGKHVVLDKTVFYPTSGGQMHDNGSLDGCNVVDVFKQGGLIVHELDKEPEFKAGDIIIGKIDKERRLQLTQNHTSTHIINAAAKKVLGNHINQAGAKKDVDKAHIDLTHYQSLTDDEMAAIEREANKIVNQRLEVKKKFFPRTQAEVEFGMRIYQGGAVPGKQLRIIKIDNLDIEACGGTHLNNTKEAGEIKLIKSNKVQDGIVRITFVAGKAAKLLEQGAEKDLEKIAKELDCNVNQVPGRVQELFKEWKTARKAKKKGKAEPLQLTSTEESPGSPEDIISVAARFIQTQPEHVLKTVQRFKKDINNWSSE